MDFYEVLDHVLALLRQRGQVSYRALKVQFHLDAEQLDALREELLYVHQGDVEDDGRGLVWTGGTSATPAATPKPGQPAQVTERLKESPAQSGSPPAAPPAPDAERRQLTVLFCDLVDSTRLANQLDPEDWREVVRAYQQTCATVIQRYEGHIAQYLGDGLLVYFGYPLAHEDDAQRAVRTGLGVMGAMASLNFHLARQQGIRLAARVGIHTGLVVVGEMGSGSRHEELALGETPNMAARLQGLAAPDTIVIGAATHRLVQGVFSAEDLGTHALKGVATPVRVYRILGESSAQSRLDAAATRGRTPVVGREQEIGLLLERWAQVKEGMGQVVVLSGEAGIGKSRLVQVLKDRVAGEPSTRLECRCSPYDQHSALYPVIELFQQALQWTRQEAPHEKLRKLEEVLTQYGVSLSEVVPLLAALLSLPLSERYPPLTLTPQRQKQKTLEAVLTVLLALAAQQPVLFIVEDLHWVDPSTLELLGLLIDQAPTARLFILLTYRPEFHPPWGVRSHVTSLTLNRLSRPQVEAIMARVAGGKSLPAEVVQQMAAKTDGVPLFVEELTKMVLESGLVREREESYELTGPLPPLAIPATLHDSLRARLDRLAAVKHVAQLGATVGRSFSYELLRAVSSLDDAILQHALAQLVAAELVYQQGVSPQATYLFKHALIQEAAYQSLLRSTRQQYHQRIAQVVEARFPEIGETQPELLAHHYTEAGLVAQAIPYWQRAGQRAIDRSANVEATRHITKGLELLKTLPDAVERTQQELLLQTTLGLALMAIKGYGAPEVESVYARARELCRQVGDAPQLFPVLVGLWGFYVVRVELRTALELAEQLLSLAQGVQDSALLLEAHYALGTTFSYRGELAAARAHLQQSIAFYDPEKRRSHAFRSVQDPAVGGLSTVANVLWYMGYADQALERIREALTLAHKLAHPFSLAFALFQAALLHYHRREGQAAQERAEAVIALCIEHGFPLWVAGGRILRGWALAEQGEIEEGVTQLRQGLAAWRAVGTEVGRPYWLAMLAEAYGAGGQAAEGLNVLAETLVTVYKSGERRWEAELYRLQGELLLARSGEHRAEAEGCFRQALDVARRQQARSLELRAAISLSRLWQQGKRDEARELLAEIYGWFTEGFDTADLQEARALLEGLA